MEMSSHLTMCSSQMFELVSMFIWIIEGAQKCCGYSRIGRTDMQEETRRVCLGRTVEKC